MHVQSVDLWNFRSYERLHLDVEPGIVVLVGPNGVGKTNCLEAIAFCLTGSSPRTSAELRCIRDGSTFLRAQVDCRDTTTTERAVVVETGRGKRLTLAGATTASVREFAVSAPAATFLPERLLVVRGAPARRRELLDRQVALLQPSDVPHRYAAALQQRNTLLRRAKAGADVRDAVEPWTTQVAELGQAYRDLRAATLDELSPRFRDRFEQLTGRSHGHVEVDLRGADLPATLASAWTLDVRRGSTTAGPHLDDIRLLEGQRDLRTHGSTGEQRASLLAWSLACADVLRDRHSTDPVLLFDEPYAELDTARRKRLSDALATFTQSFVTTTEPPQHLLGRASVTFHAVRSGAIEPWTPTT